MNIDLNGQVATLYSFKGGVGRTMALANVAYLCAVSGLKVLIMDWDLEAPGLAYYFRGLLDAHEARSLKECPGILDMLWDWSNSVNSIDSEEETRALIRKFESGIPFTNLVRSVNESHFQDYHGALHYIGAGGKVINTGEPEAYEDALARFSWPIFFENQAGGIVLDALRKWAKANYDIVLLDSRTGLADVAGICTMQLPDLVGLCFILNRQNIDGVAKVAGAIRAKRNEEIPIVAIPMRVTRSDTAEESDARARAASELTRIGGFSSEAVTDDFRLNSIMASDGIPFYETLAPFAANTPKLDPLTLNYVQLTESILDKIGKKHVSISVPQYDSAFLELAKRRLQPRHATADYVLKLRNSEPARVVPELQRLLEGALETEVNGGELDDEYIVALADIVINISEFSEDPFDAINLQLQALDLLRSRAAALPDKWNGVLLRVLERHLDEFSFIHARDEELALLEEIDTLLAVNFTVANWLKRIRRRRQAGRLYIGDQNYDAAMQTVGEINTQLKDIQRTELANDQIAELVSAEIDVTIMQGEVLLGREQRDQAYAEFKKGVSLASKSETLNIRELARLRSDLHFKLATAPSAFIPIEEAAEHAIQTVRWAQSLSWVPLFNSLAKILTQSKNSDLAFKFSEMTLGAPESLSQRSMITSYFGRQVKSALSFLENEFNLLYLIKMQYQGNLRFVELSNSAAGLTDLVTKGVLRRKQTIGEKPALDLGENLTDLFQIYLEIGVAPQILSELFETISKISPTSRNRLAKIFQGNA